MSDFSMPRRARRFENHPLIEQALFAVEGSQKRLVLRASGQIVSRLYYPSLVESLDSGSFFRNGNRDDAFYEKALESLSALCDQIESLPV